MTPSAIKSTVVASKSQLSKSTASWLVVIVLVIHAGMLGFSAYVHSPMTDEIAHFAAGLGHWRYGDFELYNVNPPLPRLVGTLPVFLTMPWDDELDKRYAVVGSTHDQNGLLVPQRKEFAIGGQLLKQLGTPYFFWMTIARCACIPFSCLGAWVCFAWATDLYGRRAGYAALLLWCTSPFVLAFGGALLPDIPSGSCGALALYRFWKWTREPTWHETYFAGLAIGVAELTKSTWLLLHPMLFLFGLVFCFRHARGLSLVPQWLSQLLLAMIVLVAGYGFTDQFQCLGQFEFTTPSLQIRELSDSGELQKIVSNRFRGTWMAAIPVPLPTELVRGLDTQESAMASHSIVGFLFGEIKMGGWWYYYFVVLAIKCTLGGLVLFAVATIVRILSLTRTATGKLQSMDYLLLLGPTVVFLGLLSYHTGLNRHARYMFQFLPLCMVWASQAVTIFPTRPFLRIVMLFFLGWGALSSLRCFPHSLAYFNELIGGSAQGHKYLSGTNIDWGQNVFYLREEIKHRKWTSVGVSLWVSYNLKLTEIEAEIKKIPRLPKPVPAVSGVHDQDLPLLMPGNYALSVCIVQGSIGIPLEPNVEDPTYNGYTYFQEFTPIGHVGHSIWLYELSEEDILRSKSWGELYRAYLKGEKRMSKPPKDSAPSSRGEK
jgi:hypothetical protein